MEYSIDEIKSALELLNIPEKSSLLEIKKIYKDLLFQWHPDRCREKKEICNKKTRRIIKSYKILLAYCENYKFSFIEEELETNPGSGNPIKFWYERFGDDPIWS